MHLHFGGGLALLGTSVAAGEKARCLRRERELEKRQVQATMRELLFVPCTVWSTAPAPGRFCFGWKYQKEIFTEVCNKISIKSSPKTCLWSIANNCMREYFRKKRRQQAVIPLIDDFADESVSDVLDELNLQDSLKQLNVIQRQVFVERVIHKRSTSETAVLLNWSQAKVRTTLHRAIVKLREVLARGDDVHA